MRAQRLAAFAGLALFLAACSDNTPSAPPANTQRTAPLYDAQSQAIPGHYIVVLQANANPRAVAALVNAFTRYEYHYAINGFAAELNQGQLNALQHIPLVDYIEEDQVITGDFTQNLTGGNPWGLDRIDQRNRPLSLTYTYNNLGTGVTAYVIDTGLLFTHVEFGGRASFGFDAFGGNGVDCNGHGTHVGGTIGGTTYGVAKGVTLVAVRVLDCGGSGPTSGVIAGVDWVTQHHAALAVANMSLGGGASTALDQAVNNSVTSGVTYAVAAGNSHLNACNYSPARAASAITVAATTTTDQRASFSNFGTCVDIFAPGQNILSAYGSGNTATAFLSGTSMASPHVAGVAALYRELNPSATPTQITSAITSNATTGVVVTAGVGSPNRLLYMGFIGSGSPPPTQNITIGSGNNQTGTAGSTLPNALVAHVADGNGNPLSGVQVTFQVTQGGGSVSPTTANTNASGNASTQLTLGPAGPQSVKASIAAGGFVTFSATSNNPAPTFTIAIGSGNNQTGTVGTTLAQSLVAHVTDSNGPAVGVTVTFQVIAGGGSLSTLSAQTNGSGDASTSLTLGPNPGDNAVSATIAGNSSVTFHANGTSPGGQTFLIAIVSGNNQSGLAGTTLSTPLKVRVTDQATGLPVAGVLVTFAVQTGGGSVTPPSALSNGEGWASTKLTLGPLPGQNTVKASLPSGAFVTFTANGN